MITATLSFRRPRIISMATGWIFKVKAHMEKVKVHYKTKHRQKLKHAKPTRSGGGAASDHLTAADSSGAAEQAVGGAPAAPDLHGDGGVTQRKLQYSVFQGCQLVRV